jgi:hypothetical protein
MAKEPINPVAIWSKGIEEATKAMSNYMQQFQNAMTSASWADTQLNQKIRQYAEQNSAAALDHIKKLGNVRDVQDFTQIQAAFIQSQIDSLTREFKDLTETGAKQAMDIFKGAGRST